jgi:hypothetical protein
MNDLITEFEHIKWIYKNMCLYRDSDIAFASHQRHRESFPYVHIHVINRCFSFIRIIFIR